MPRKKRSGQPHQSGSDDRRPPMHERKGLLTDELFDEELRHAGPPPTPKWPPVPLVQGLHDWRDHASAGHRQLQQLAKPGPQKRLQPKVADAPARQRPRDESQQPSRSSRTTGAQPRGTVRAKTPSLPPTLPARPQPSRRSQHNANKPKQTPSTSTDQSEATTSDQLDAKTSGTSSQ